MNPNREPLGAISLRLVQDNDDAFLLQVFASTREAERQSMQWELGEWETFIQLQYRAQKIHYTTHFPAAAQDIILCDAKPVGCMWVNEAEDEIRLLDIAILPVQRSRGIGTHLIRRLQHKAARADVPLRHSVELTNPRAQQLYVRLGFEAIETRGLHTLMEWMPHDDVREPRSEASNSE
jgi:ribosomal protein S18 acetylase RimI-like enzyme